MLRKFLYTCLFLLCLFNTKGQSIPSITIETIEHDTVPLNKYLEKKVLIIVLPVSHSADDSLSLLSIDSAYNSYKDSITFIGVPSYEDGFSDSLNIALSTWYKDTLHLSFIITNGMHTRQSTLGDQSSLFQWLTDETFNGHFGTNIASYGQKFLLDQNGELKGVFDSETILNNKLMDIIIGM